MAKRTGAVKRFLPDWGNFFLWTPVCFGAGAILYLRLPFEPALWLAPALFVVCGLILPTGRWRSFFLTLLCFLAGFSWTALYARLVVGPDIPPGVYQIEGEVMAVDRSRTGRERIMLRVLKTDVERELPWEVRVSFIAAKDYGLRPGMGVRLRTQLGPPPGPAIPGGYDYALWAHFAGLDAVGYTRVAPQVLSDDARNLATHLQRFRFRVSNYLNEHIGGQGANVLAAVTVGDRRGLTQAFWDNMRIAGLAHLMAISGLHMGLITVMAYQATRLVGSLLPYRRRAGVSVKKLAAFLALLVGLLYLLISGASYPTQRAFVIAAVAFTGVLFDRDAITFRGLAIAALVILTLQPSAVLQPGFQMSFAAATALVGIYQHLGWFWSRLPRYGARAVLLRFLAGTLITTFVAGLATTPLAAFHFHRVSSYGLLANLLAVPVFALWVMPWAFIGLILAPFSIDFPLWLSAQGIELIAYIAGEVARLPGAAHPVGAGRHWALAATLMGGFLFCLAPRKNVFAALTLCLGGLLFWTAPKPDALLSSRGSGLFAWRNPDGLLALSHERSQGYSAALWLEHDADPASQAEATRRRGLRCHKRQSCVAEAGGRRIVWLRQAKSVRWCEAGDIILAPGAHSKPANPECAIFNADDIPSGEVLALYINGQMLKTQSTAQRCNRVWARESCRISSAARGR